MSNLFTAVSVEQQEIVAGGRTGRGTKVASNNDFKKVIKSFNENKNSFNTASNSIQIIGVELG